MEDPQASRDIRRLELPHVAAHLPTTDALEALVQTIRSDGEMFLRTSNVYDVGTEIVCELVHPDTRRNLPLEARVTRSQRVPRRERGMEFEFLDLTEDDLDDLEAFVRGEEILEPVTTPPDLPDVPG
jgi:Tfp pilus assembly protein PilZ